MAAGQLQITSYGVKNLYSAQGGCSYQHIVFMARHPRGNFKVYRMISCRSVSWRSLLHHKIYDSHCAGNFFVLQVKESAAGGGGTKDEERVILDKNGAEESAAVKQMSTLVDLMRQQMEWTMRSEDGRREQGLGAAEALETRMRGMEVTLLDFSEPCYGRYCN